MSKITQLIREQLYALEQIKVVENALTKMYVGRYIEDSIDGHIRIDSVRVFNTKQGPIITFFFDSDGCEQERSMTTREIRQALMKAVKAYRVNFTWYWNYDQVIELHRKCEILRDECIGIEAAAGIKYEAMVTDDFVVSVNRAIIGIVKSLGRKDTSLPDIMSVKNDICAKYDIKHSELYFEQKE